jgi:hypothetical protein
MQVSKCMDLDQLHVTLGNPLTLHFFKCFPKFFGALLLCPLLKGQTNEVQLSLTVLIKDRPSWAIARSCFTVTNVKKNRGEVRWPQKTEEKSVGRFRPLEKSESRLPGPECAVKPESKPESGLAGHLLRPDVLGRALFGPLRKWALF